MVFLAGFVLVILVVGIGSCTNRIRDDEALARFKELTRTTDIVIVRKSNSAYIIGDPHDVVYELKVAGKPVTGRCTSNVFSPMVCRVYTWE